jgi:hypothetical protein
VGGLAGLLAALFRSSPGGGVLPGGAPLGQGGIGANAAGTDNWRGGWTWVGERGPELINLPRGSQVVPNDIARSAGGVVRANYAPVVNINGNADAVTVGKLEQVLANERRQFQSRTVAAITDARRRSMAI